MDLSTTFKYRIAVVLEIIGLRDVLQSQPVNFCRILDVAITFVEEIKVAVGLKRSTNRNLKEIITIECTKTVIFQLLRPLGISKLATRELIK